MKVSEMLCGNQDAERLWYLFYRIAHVWDDLIDKDKPVTRADIDEVFWYLLCEIPLNRFYQQHFASLHPLIVNACMAYKTSVDYQEARDEKGMELGHVLRYNVANVLSQMALICGGREHAERVNPTLYKEAIGDRLSDYLDEMKNAD